MSRSMTLDFATETDPDEPGTILYGKRNHWRVVDARPIESRVWPFRWKYQLEPLGPHGDQIPPDARRIATYRRGETPQEYFAEHFGVRP